MLNLKLYFATNREAIFHDGKLNGFSEYFSKSEPGDIRFGEVEISFSTDLIENLLSENVDGYLGNGQDISEKIKDYILDKDNDKKINAELYEENRNDLENPILGSIKLFSELREQMLNGDDVVIFVHGYNVDWITAVADGISLQCMLNKDNLNSPFKKNVKIVLFSWPSEGNLLLYTPYVDDRRKAELSGEPFGRAILKLGDYLYRIRKEATIKRLKENSSMNPSTSDFHKNRSNEDKLNNYGLCGSNIHIICHSMGCYVLQNAIKTISDYTISKFDDIFENIFLCAPDLDNDVFESGKPLSRLHEICQTISVYFSKDDKALSFSHYTKRFTDRLGKSGPIRPDVNILTKKVHFIDVSNKVNQFLEHGYFLSGITNYDIRESINDIPQSKRKHRKGDKVYINMWRFI